MVGMVISISGEREGRPYLASSQARSMYSTEGQMCIVALCCGPGLPAERREFRHAAQREIHLERRSLGAELADAVDELSRQIARVHQLQERAARVQIAGDDRGADFLAALQHDALDAAIANQNLLDGSVGSNHRAACCGPNRRWRSKRRPCRRARIPTIRDGR